MEFVSILFPSFMRLVSFELSEYPRHSCPINPQGLLYYFTLLVSTLAMAFSKVQNNEISHVFMGLESMSSFKAISLQSTSDGIQRITVDTY
jgi:hypothetical protein